MRVWGVGFGSWPEAGLSTDLGVWGLPGTPVRRIVASAATLSRFAAPGVWGLGLRVESLGFEIKTERGDKKHGEAGRFKP